MKIGVVTFWQSTDNYGQLLQMYALQQVLKIMGHSPYVIRYDFENRTLTSNNKIRRILKRMLYPVFLIKKLQRKLRIRNRHRQDSSREFDDFKIKHIDFSIDFYHSLSDLKRNSPEADTYIVGSDQVWSQLLSEEENKVFFLDFGKEYTNRISYAASFGMENYPTAILPTLKKCLLSFNAISCREKSGVKICSSAGISASRVLDPTLLLVENDYNNLGVRKRWDIPYIYIYSLNIEKEEDIQFDRLKKYSTDMRLKIKVTNGSGYIEKRDLFLCEAHDAPKVEDWLSNIKYANAVVTTSFHGVVFCILFHTPFVYIPLKGRFSGGNNRAIELLTDLKLSDRILSEQNGYNEILSNRISWDCVNSKLTDLKKNSISFLQNAINPKD